MKKKLIITAMILVGAALTAKASTMLEPEWTEFCPPRYCDSNKNKFSKDATYWYKRRMQFEKALAKCSTYSGAQLDSCYNEIRAAEARKNKVWEVRQEEKYRTTEYNREYEMERMRFYGVNRILETIKK